MKGIIFPPNLKVGQLNFEVIAQTAAPAAGKHPLSRAFLDVWKLSFGVDSVLQGAEGHHSGMAL